MSFKNKPLITGIVLLSLLVLVESIQLVIVLGILSNFIPFGTDPFNADLFPIYKSELKPNWQIQIYHFFIMASLTAQIFLIYGFRRKLEQVEFQATIRRLLCADTLWVFIQCFAIFKVLVYNSPAWAWSLFYVSLAASMLSRIFWVELAQLFSKAEGSLRTGFSSLEITFSPNEFLWTPLFIIVESIQVLIGVNWLGAHTRWWGPVFSWGVFIISVAAFSLLAWSKNIRYFRTRPFIIAETMITFLLLSALFKMVIYDYRNQLATDAFHILLLLALLNKICWPVIWNASNTVYRFLTSSRNARVLRTLGDCLMVGLIVAIVYLPDPQAVLAKIYVGEQFHHMNHFIMAPGWAYVSGCVLDVDVISRYGIGFPIVLSTLAKWIGGFSHLNILRVIMGICIIYYVLSYFFLRIWLKSFALAVAAILVGIKVQMFYTLTLPQPFTYASGTPVRFICDIFFMFCIWGHLCTRRWIYLWMAAICCAAALFYMLETGLYLTAAFGGYLAMHGLSPTLRREMFFSRKGQVSAALSVLAVPVGAFLFYGLAVGGHVFTAQFWHNTFEFSQYFTKGLFMGPYWGGLQYGQFWDLLIGFLFPIVYVLTILIVGTLCVLGQLSKKNLMVLVLCFYGLGAHHYYIAMATANNYYMRGLPFVFVCFYWVHLGLSGLKRDMRRHIGIALVFISAYALGTNHHYLSYPNIFNFSRNPMVDPLVAEELPDRKPYLLHKVWDIPESQKLSLNSLGQQDEGLQRNFATDQELKDYYAQQNNYPEDARLISSLTAPDEPVALISSYEIEMLMQADRKPLFYYFSMTFSRPLRMRNFGAAEIFTHGQLKRLIDQLKTARSPYVFMERIFLDRNVPSTYAYDNPGLMGLLDYVNSHYEPYQTGKYLVALKRKIP